MKPIEVTGRGGKSLGTFDDEREALAALEREMGGRPTFVIHVGWVSGAAFAEGVSAAVDEALTRADMPKSRVAE